MAKFGEIINSAVPTLIDFYKEKKDDKSILQHILQDVAVALGDRAKVIKIDISKNEKLVNALRIKGSPTFIIYKNGDMKWRQSGNQDADTLIDMMQQFI
jgi:thioredoxin 1